MQLFFFLPTLNIIISSLSHFLSKQQQQQRLEHTGNGRGSEIIKYSTFMHCMIVFFLLEQVFVTTRPIGLTSERAHTPVFDFFLKSCHGTKKKIFVVY
jgi:hypothetical protein